MTLNPLVFASFTETYLAEVELRILLGGNTLNLDEGSVGAGVALAALVAEQAALRVESTRREWSCKPLCP